MNALAHDLQPGFSILWYQIESVLGRGGFGITYLATDTNLGQLVAIKEYLPHDFATRSGDSTVQPVSIEQSDMFSWGLERFMSEAKTLAKFKHPNIVRVLSVFKQNNTGYMVMEYEHGEDLSDIYKRKNRLSQQELEQIYYPIIDGLHSVHNAGFIHRDIKPSNIFIRDDGSPVLIDFGAARQAVGTRTRTLTSMLSVGYAPFEQYNEVPGKQGPWTDIYALGASMYQGITGEKPMESTQRGMALLHDETDPYEPLSVVSRPTGYSHSMLRAIDQALMVQIHDRPQTLDDFLGMLQGEIVLADLPPGPAKAPEATVIREKTVIRPRNRQFSGVSSSPVVTTEQSENDSRQQNPAPHSEAAVQVGSAQTFNKANAGKPAMLFISVAVIGISLALLAYLLWKGQQTVDPQQAQIQLLLNQARQSITEGSYYDESGQGALNRYLKIQQIDARNPDAKKGIDRVAGLMLKEALNAIENRQFSRASERIKTLDRYVPKLTGLDEAKQTLSTLLESDKRLKQVETLLGMADAAREKGHIYEPGQESAAAYYQQVLELDQANDLARRGLADSLDKIITDIQRAIQSGNLDRAEKLLSIAQGISPDNHSLKNLHAEVSEAIRLKDLLTRAGRAYSQAHYLFPSGENAYTLYKKVLTVSPAHAEAQQRLRDIANFYVDKTRRYIQEGKLSEASRNIALLRSRFPDYAQLSSLKAELEQKRERLTVANKPPVVPNSMLPVDVDQNQTDSQVVEEVFNRFKAAFNLKSLDAIQQVSELSDQQKALYQSIFNSYKSLGLTVVPNSFMLRKTDGIASLKFEISDLIDTKGRPVVTSASWKFIEVKISRKNGAWLKAKIY